MRDKLKSHRLFDVGIMVLIVVLVSFSLLAVVLNLEGTGRILNKIGEVISPILLGVVFAYLMNPMMNFMNRRLLPFFRKKGVEEAKAYKWSRALSVVFAVACSLILLYEFFAMLAPQLYESIAGIVGNFSSYYASMEQWITRFLADNPVIQDYAIDLFNNSFTMVTDWVTNGLLPNIETIISGLTSSVMSVVGAALDILIGFCAAVYMLCSKDRFMAQAKKVVVALCKEQTADHIFDLGRRTHQIFSGFIIGKILDSMIIGILCYLGMLVLKLPYPALVATVVGVTNVIPFFGPFIGAIPSTFLILLVNPLKAVYFAIFVLALQQLDGNVIGPRILGDTIGISGFWVLVSITVAGGLFGFTGMLLGVPVFAVIYMLVNDFVVYKLKKKGKPVETPNYFSIQKVEDLALPKEETKE